MYVKLQDLPTLRWGFINIDNLQAIEMSEEEYNQIPCDNWFYEHFISKERIKELEEHLEEFGCHKTSCDYPLEPCSCGFEEALKGIK